MRVSQQFYGSDVSFSGRDMPAVLVYNLSGLLRQYWLTGKDSDAEKDWGQEEKGATEDEMVEWHHWLTGHESEQAPGDSEGQGSLACCSSWGHRVGHDLVTEQQPDSNRRSSVLQVHIISFWIIYPCEYMS